MDRRDFLKATVAAGVAAAAQGMVKAEPKATQEEKGKLQKRPLGQTGEELSIIGFGGIVVMNAEPEQARERVREAIEAGVNYFDVAPTYGDAEEKLGPALEPYRQQVFLACKTAERTREGAARELAQSLERLRTDHFDLYQLHGLSKMEDLETALGPGGALETFLEAREKGQVRFLGFSAHSVEVALAAMERFPFDTILFPFNYTLYFQANFGPQVLARARDKGMGCLALKALARQVWPEEANRAEYPKCWYQPVTHPKELELALRFTLSEPLTAAIPPGDERLFRQALKVARDFRPLNEEERIAIRVLSEGLTPIMRLAA
jgi:predicted aldo/keto reductase-like oxidoreductase